MGPRTTVGAVDGRWVCFAVGIGDRLGEHSLKNNECADEAIESGRFLSTDRSHCCHFGEQAIDWANIPTGVLVESPAVFLRPSFLNEFLNDIGCANGTVVNGALCAYINWTVPLQKLNSEGEGARRDFLEYAGRP